MQITLPEKFFWGTFGFRTFRSSYFSFIHGKCLHCIGKDEPSRWMENPIRQHTMEIHEKDELTTGHCQLNMTL